MFSDCQSDEEMVTAEAAEGRNRRWFEVIFFRGVKMGGPRNSCFYIWFITPITMVYHTYNYS